jgi:hypothetical protein
MLSLPYDFDTADSWEKIVKIFLIVSGIYLAMVVGLLLEAQFVAGLIAVLFGLALWRMLRAVPQRIGMGARGRLSATDVTTHPVKVWGYALNVPVGRFPISGFSDIAVVERVVVMRPETASSLYGNIGSVRLLGKNGTPDIEIVVATIDAANAFASTVSSALKLPVRALAAPGTTIVRISL